MDVDELSADDLARASAAWITAWAVMARVAKDGGGVGLDDDHPLRGRPESVECDHHGVLLDYGERSYAWRDRVEPEQVLEMWVCDGSVEVFGFDVVGCYLGTVRVPFDRDEP